MTIFIRLAHWSSDQKEIQDVRTSVFIDEQNVSSDEEWDDFDAHMDTQHIVALDQESQLPVATARVLDSGKIGRVAVLKDYRGKGIGQDITRKAIELALQKNTQKIYLEAQTHALSFYEALGFTAYGELFMDAGIEHQRMRFVQSQTSLSHVYSDTVLRFENIQAPIQHLQQQFFNAKRTIDIYSHKLRSDIFSSPQVARALSELARRSRHSHVRILIQDSSSLIGRFHRLIDLSQRLSSRIELRILPHDDSELGTHDSNKHFSITDSSHLVYFNNESNSIGFAQYSAQVQIKSLRNTFDYLWENHAKIDPNAKQIHL